MYRHIRIRPDNTTAIAYVIICEKYQIHVIQRVWKKVCTYCIDMNLWLTAVHISWKENNFAEYDSKLPVQNTKCNL